MQDDTRTHGPQSLDAPLKAFEASSQEQEASFNPEVLKPSISAPHPSSLPAEPKHKESSNSEAKEEEAKKAAKEAGHQKTVAESFVGFCPKVHGFAGKPATKHCRCCRFGLL